MGNVAAARVGDTIVVVDTTSTLRYFDSNGQILRTAHIRGNGGVRLSRVMWIGPCGGDSLYVWDARSGLVVFDRSDRPVRHMQPPGPSMAVSCSEEGDLAFLRMPTASFKPSDLGRVPPTSTSLVVTDRNGTVRAEREVPAGEYRPAGRVTHIAMSGDRVYVATGESAFVDVYDTALQHRGSVALGVVLRTVTPQTYDEAVAHQIAPKHGSDSLKRALIHQAPMPPTFPASREIYSSPDGTLWVVVSTLADSVLTLRAFSSSGRMLGDASFAQQTVVLAAYDDCLLTTYVSRSGITHVDVYRVTTQRSLGSAGHR